MKGAFRKMGMDKMGVRKGVDSMVVRDIGTVGTELAGDS
jgi:hypothetical protein